MHLSSLDTATKVKVNMEGAKDAFKQIPISKADGTPTFSFRVFTLEPGGHTPHHTHNFEHLNYVIKGRGTLVAEDGEHKIKKGDFVLVLPNEKHQYKNNSPKNLLVMICAVPKEYE